MFKKIPPKILLNGCGPASTIVCEKNFVNGVERTKFVSKTLDEAYKLLPSVDNFSLENQLKAGVSLQPVDSNLLSSDLNVDDLNVPFPDVIGDSDVQTDVE